MKKSFRKILFCLLALLAFGFFGIELFLRWHYGLCDAVLMKADDDFEYIAKPDQTRKRFGNRVAYNEYSMRSGPVRAKAVKILCTGDSIVNGGTLTDQADLATEILEKNLSALLKRDIQVLNVSAGSWGPDNCAAYLKRYGAFQAKVLILVTSSHDAYDTMTFVPVVGRTKYFPTRQYPLAVIELLDRYLYSDNKIYNLSKDQLDTEFRKAHHITRNAGRFNPGFALLKEIAGRQKIPFLIYLHATRAELTNGKYDPEGQLILDFAMKNNVPVICDLEHGLSEEWFRDPIHYNAAGQRNMAELLLPFCRVHLERAEER